MSLLFAALLLLQVQADDLPVTTIDSAVKGLAGYGGRNEAKPVDDAGFVRRLYRDVLGADPSDAELNAFVNDPAPKKRTALVDRLVADDRFNTFWARRFTRVFFGDPALLRINGMPGVEAGAVQGFETWLTGRFRKDTPWTEIVAAMLKARGSLKSTPEMAYMLSFNRGGGPAQEFPEGLAKQLLGIRLYCARCHDHPYDKWRAEDYYGLSSYVIGQQATLVGGVPTIDYIDAGNAAMPSFPNAPKESDVKFAQGGTIPPNFLFGGTATGVYRIDTLAQFMTAKANTQLPRMLVNRVWGWIYGHGLVDPVDDFNLKNKSIGVALQEGLVRDTITNGYSLKRLVRLICSTQTYAMKGPDEAPDAESVRHYLARKFALGNYAFPGFKQEKLSLDFTVPESWTWVRPRSGGVSGARMLYKVPDPKDPSRNAELWISERKPSTDLVALNPRQYEKPKTASVPVAGALQTTLQELRGRYLCPRGGDGPVDYEVLTALFDPPGGVAMAFRLEGPTDLVDHWRETFVELLKGVKPR